MTKRHLDVRPLMEKLCPPHNVAGTRQRGVGWILSVVRNSEVFIGLPFKHRPNNKSPGDRGSSTRTELSVSSAIGDCAMGWVGWLGRWLGWSAGVAETAERWQILLEPRMCHSFQLEENKSICEAATGAERTFCEGSVFVPLPKEHGARVCMRTCADECAVARCHFGCRAGWFNRCSGCHWLAQLVIIWLDSDVKWALQNALTQIKENVQKINEQMNAFRHLELIFFFLTGDHQLSKRKILRLECVFVGGTELIRTSRSFKAVI